MKLCAVSVDLDEIPNYAHIHGLSNAPGLDEHAVYDRAIDRLVGMAAAAQLPLTLFAVGSDLARPEAANKLRDARALGHEIANHSQNHLYDLTRRTPVEMRSEVEEGSKSIERAVGAAPRGFRAPGYIITDALFRVLEELRVSYDSSVFPCPGYQLAKGAAISAIHLAGRRSHSLIDTPMVLTAPTVPYRVGTPYWRRGNGIQELPIQVTRGARLPFIGTTITLGGPDAARALAHMCVGDELINLELHGIDVLDASDGLEALSPYQRDVRVNKERKLDALHAVYETLKNAGYSFVTMSEAASRVG